MASNDDDFDKELDAVHAAVDAKFAVKLTLPSNLLQEICPSPVDRKALEKLMAAVNSAATENEAKEQLIQHAESCGVIVVRLLRKLAIGV